MLTKKRKCSEHVLHCRECYKISECIDHMDAYTNLTDSIFHLILLSQIDNEHVRRAQEILSDIQSRKLYKCIGESVPITDTDTIQKDVSSEKDKLF